MNEREALERLGSIVVAARVAAGMRTTKALADATGLSSRLLGDVETGRRRVGRASYALIEQALSWERGSVDLVIAGGEPITTTALPNGERVASGLMDDEDVAAIMDAVRRVPERGLPTLDDVRSRLDAVILEAVRAQRMLDRLASAP